MKNREAIGGYFELELNSQGSIYHDSAIAVCSARHGLEYILRTNSFSKIYIPFYTCYVTLEPIKAVGMDFEFYHIDEFFNPKIDSIKDDEVLLYVNYFGLMNLSIKNLKNSYRNIIVDNAQGFFSEPYKEIHTIYSSRKFFGLSDGGFVYTQAKKKLFLERDISFDRMSHLLVRSDGFIKEGYKEFINNDAALSKTPLLKMSLITEKLLRSTDFKKIKIIRNKNFIFLHNKLKDINELSEIIEKDEINSPMIYPFLVKGNADLREKLIAEKIYTATYWPNVIDWVYNEKSLEHYLVNNLIALPIDQRYNADDMARMLNVINKYKNV